ncbi:MAG: DUF1273 family protein [Clostridia bacterium]|nr:DUF1273 family protein [Clostridia bacterium]
MKACVTGHRPQTLNKLMKYGDFNDIPYMEYNDAVFYTVFKAMKDGFDYFYSGGAIGVDSDWADAVLYTRDSHSEFADKNIKLEIAIPCENQDAKWYPKDKEHYAELLEKADKLTYVGKKYTFDCMQKRNEYMVDNSDKVFAFWNGEEKGGTWNTIQYARKKGKDLEIIDLRKICDMSNGEEE